MQENKLYSPRNANNVGHCTLLKEQLPLTLITKILVITFYSRLAVCSMAERNSDVLPLEEFSASFDNRDAIT
jgi:hypothetical protein